MYRSVALNVNGWSPAQLLRRPTGEYPTLVLLDPTQDESSLADVLACLGRDAVCVRSAQESLEAIRHIMPVRAVVPVEMTMHGRSMISCLSALPSIHRLIAIGPADEPKAEALARSAGADAYLVRPVSMDVLVAALNLGATKPSLTGWTAGCQPRAVTRSRGWARYGCLQ